MAAPTRKFSGGTPGAREKLDRVVEVTNRLQQIRGDGTFISVTQNSFGTVISLVINAVVSRVAKLMGAGGAVPPGVLFAVKVKKVGGNPGGNGFDCSFVYDVYPCTTEWPTSGDPPSSERIGIAIPPETEVIQGTMYSWNPTAGVVWGWALAFYVLEGDPPASTLYLYHVADEKVLTDVCACP